MDDKFLKNNLIARWLNNSLSEDEKKALEDSEELDGLKAIIEDVDTWKIEPFDTEAGLEDLKNRKKHLPSNLSQNQQTSRKSWLKIAASLLFLVTAGYFSLNYLFNSTVTITTQIAENKAIVFPDGSEVKLDAVSSINYKEKDWENNRVINLKGQAFFKVAKGSTFKVLTNTGTVEVLGTQFNVKALHKTFEVKCYEGKVAVNYNNYIEILTQGQTASVKNNKLFNGENTAKTPPWMNGFSRYNQVVLSDVIKDLERYYNINILLPKAYRNLQFSGTLTHKNLNIALETLFTSMEITYNVDENNNVTFE